MFVGITSVCGNYKCLWELQVFVGIGLGYRNCIKIVKLTKMDIDDTA